jgi:hypothetical protein
MEAELLRGMITDRDLRMEKIQRKSQEQGLLNTQLQQQLQHVIQEAQQQSMTITAEQNQLQQQHQSILNQLEQMQRDFKQQGASLKTYSQDTSGKMNGSSSSDASYVMRMQAQLCKAMHSLGITDHQMELATKHHDLIVKYQKDTLLHCREDRTGTELHLMNQLIEKDNERRSIEERYKSQLDAIAKEQEALERQMEESGHNLEDDDDDAENNNNEDDDDDEDVEEKEVKEELMQLLSEKRSEMDRLEILCEEQEELIVDLEEQLAEGGPGSGTITQRKSQILINPRPNESMEQTATATTTITITDTIKVQTDDSSNNDTEEADDESEPQDDVVVDSDIAVQERPPDDNSTSKGNPTKVETEVVDDEIEDDTNDNSHNVNGDVVETLGNEAFEIAATTDTSPSMEKADTTNVEEVPLPTT